MNFIRKLLGFFTAIAFVALAAPATAQNVKYFTLTAPASVAVSTTSVELQFKNVDNGNSSFNSIGVKATTEGGATIAINSGTASPGGPGNPMTAGGFYYLTNLSPVKKGQTLTVTLNVTINGSGCEAGKISWIGRAFTGSPSQPSTEFTQQNAGAEVTKTTVNKNCTYSYTITDKIYKGDKDKTLVASVSNPAGSSASIGSITLTPPAGITASAFAPSGFPVAAGESGTVDITASAPCDASGAGGAWASSVTDFSVSGGDKSTSVLGNCKLAFSGLPTSIVPDTTFDVKVRLYNDANDGTITSFIGSVKLNSTGDGCTIVGTNPVDAASGEASLSVKLTVDPAATICKLQGETTIGTTTFKTQEVTLTVFDGLLGCTSTTFNALDLPATGAGTFDASEGGADAPGETGFLAGVRGYDPDKGVCSDLAKANYAVFNNLPTAYSGTMTDPLGNVVAGGFYSLTWDASQVDPVSGLLLRPVVAVIATLRPEWGAALTGLPTKQTLICTVTPCTAAPYTVSGAINTAGGWKPAVACLSTLVLHSSIPAGEPGCLASERWDVVPAAECPGSPPDGAVPPEGRCLKPTSIMLMGQDPVFGRGN